MEAYVDRTEFEALKKEVEEIKTEQKQNADLLHDIDKKIDSICQKMEDSEKYEELKFKPLAEKVEKIESSNTWLWRAIAGAIITLAVKIIFDVNH